MELHLQAIITLLALVNPAMCAAIFARSVGRLSRAAQLAAASRAALTVLVILVLAALFGARVLHAFGVSLDAFSVAGGGVLAWIGLSMLRGNDAKGKTAPSDAPSPETSPPEATDVQASLAPLVMFAASPGTITGVITLAVAHARLKLPVTALVAVAVATAVMWLVIVLVIYLGGRKPGGGFVRDTATRFMGLIVVAMGVQFALNGIKAFMQG